MAMGRPDADPATDLNEKVDFDHRNTDEQGENYERHSCSFMQLPLSRCYQSSAPRYTGACCLQIAPAYSSLSYI